jgi:tetratricopeptide (TPR) repeat protein
MKKAFIVLLSLMFLATAAFCQRALKQATRKFNHVKYEVALEKANTFLKSNPNHQDALLLKGEFAFELNRYAESISTLRMLINPSPYVMRMIGRAHYWSEEYDSALVYIQLSKPDQSDATYYSDLALTYFQLYDLDSAIHYFDEALRLDPKHATYYLDAGITATLNEEGDLACAYYYLADFHGHPEANKSLEENNCISWQREWMEVIEGDTLPNMWIKSTRLLIPDRQIVASKKYQLHEGRGKSSIVTVKQIKLTDFGYLLKLEKTDGVLEYKMVDFWNRSKWRLSTIKKHNRFIGDPHTRDVNTPARKHLNISTLLKV